MKKIISGLSLAAYLSLASSDFAATTTQLQTCASGFTALCNLSTDNFGKLIGTLLQFIFVIAVVAALFILFGEDLNG